MNNKRLLLIGSAGLVVAALLIYSRLRDGTDPNDPRLAHDILFATPGFA